MNTSTSFAKITLSVCNEIVSTRVQNHSSQSNTYSILIGLRLSSYIVKRNSDIDDYIIQRVKMMSTHIYEIGNLDTILSIMYRSLIYEYKNRPT